MGGGPTACAHAGMAVTKLAELVQMVLVVVLGLCVVVALAWVVFAVVGAADGKDGRLFNSRGALFVVLLQVASVSPSLQGPMSVARYE